MNKNDEHLIFEALSLFDGYQTFPNNTGFVQVLTKPDMEACLEQHPNWRVICCQPPILVYDDPSFATQADLMDYFCSHAANSDQQNHISGALGGAINEMHDPKWRSYRLVLYSAKNPIKPIGFSCFDLGLIEDEPAKLGSNVNMISLKFDFLYAYVLPEFRYMGFGAIMGMSMGSLFWQQIKNVWQQIKDTETALTPLIYSENFSRGGQEIIKTVLRELKMFSDSDNPNDPISHLMMPQIITG